MFSLNKVNSPLGSSFQEPVFQNHRKVRNLEARYLNDGYKKSAGYKVSKAEQQKFRKQQQSQNYIRKRQQYMNDLEENRQNKSLQRSFLANHYEEMINNRRQKQVKQKSQEKVWEKNLLNYPTWLRDKDQEREIYKMKMQSYSNQLQQHVQQQERRKRNEGEEDRRHRQKLNAEAQEILDKEYKELQEKHRKKTTFEQRQNELLGIRNISSCSDTSQLSKSMDYQSIALKKREQQEYGLGLQKQLNMSESRKKKQKQVGHHFRPGQYYNPITNPIPRVYKNPNVLRMLGS